MIQSTFHADERLMNSIKGLLQRSPLLSPTPKVNFKKQDEVNEYE